MNRIYSYNNRHSITFDVVDGAVLDAPSDVVDKNQQLLDLIFTNDPVTGMPTGDLALFTNEKANPEIKRFIELNLLHENAEVGSSLNLPDDIANKFRGTINDDDIAQFSRNHDESREDYANRMRQWFVDEKRKRMDDAARKRLKRYFGEN